MFNELKAKIKNLAISNELPKLHFSLINFLKRESSALKPDEFIKKISRIGLSLFNPWEWGIKWVPTLELERVISSLNSFNYKSSIIT